MDIHTVQTNLAAALASVVTVDSKKLHTYEYVPNLPIMPAFYVAEYDIEPYMSMGARYRVLFKTRLLVASSTDRQGQKILAKLLSETGAGSVFAAIEAARGAPGVLALSGAADDVTIRGSMRVQMFQIGDSSYYGAEIPIEVIGS